MKKHRAVSLQDREVALNAAMGGKPVNRRELSIDDAESILAIAIEGLSDRSAIFEQRVHNFAIFRLKRFEDIEKLIFTEGQKLVLLFSDDGQMFRIVWPIRRAFEEAVAVLIVETHAPITEKDAEEKPSLQVIVEKLVAAPAHYYTHFGGAGNFTPRARRLPSRG